MRTILICHDEEMLDRTVLPRWLASFSTLAGIVVLRETGEQKWRRIRRQIKRVGLAHFVDVAAFRLYHKLFLAASDRRWELQTVEKFCRLYREVPASTSVLVSASPNTPEVVKFIRSTDPDLMIARCKVILKESVFTIPRDGTFVMHPGICPEYRNSHGCFWALANDDIERVGMTLLRIDRGVDTGPVFGYYRCQYNECTESHIVIQNKTVFENLEGLTAKLLEIHEGKAAPIDVSGRKSVAWGAPWLTRYLHWKRTAKQRAVKIR
jgi:methionyl-tRNA formyltransferase